MEDRHKLLGKLKDNNEDYKNTLTYLFLKHYDLINRYLNKDIKNVLDIIDYDTKNKTFINKRINNNILKFKDKKCIIFNMDFMKCRSPLAEGQEYGLRFLVEIMKANDWKVYINSGDNKDNIDYIEDINLLIKYSDCNTPNTLKYYNNPNIELVFGGINNKWVDYYLNKYKIYSYPFIETSKIPSKIIKRFIDDDYLKTIKKYIKENKNDIEYEQFIIKPLYTFSGKGIKYINRKCKTEELNKLLNASYFPYVIQPLIKNINRIHNKINHFRTHVLVSCFLKYNNQKGGEKREYYDVNSEDFNLFKDKKEKQEKQKDYNLNFEDFDLFKANGKKEKNIIKDEKFKLSEDNEKHKEYNVNSEDFDLFKSSRIKKEKHKEKSKGFKVKHLNLKPEDKEYLINVSYFNKHFILTAKDSESLDSHGKTTDHFRSLEDYVDKFETPLSFNKINKQVEEIINTFKTIIENNFKSDKFNFVYNDRLSTFSLFAFDFMILSNGNIKLIEINYKVGTTFWLENTKEMKEFYSWIYENGIKPMEK